MASRIGRKHASETYPNRGGAGAQGAPFARNSAAGPPTNQLLTGTGSTQVDWASIESTGAPGTSVPITPRVTGVILIQAVIVVSNGAGTVESVTVGIGPSGGAPVQPLSVVELGPTGTAASEVAIPVQVVFTESAAGTTQHIAVFVTASAANDITIVAGNSFVSIQELVAPTG